jgi:hypothetical protein
LSADILAKLRAAAPVMVRTAAAPSSTPRRVKPCAVMVGPPVLHGKDAKLMPSKISTGCPPEDRAGAERALGEHLADKYKPPFPRPSFR